MAADSARVEVVIAGGSIAALETLGAATRLAGDRLSITLIAPEGEFTYRPSALDPEPGVADSAVSLERLGRAFGARHVRDRISWVDPASRMVHTAAGHRVAYDALVVAIGARATAASPHALTLEPAAAAAIQELYAGARTGRVSRAVFVAPERTGWLLALYETALATAHAAEEAGCSHELTVLTAERAPLAVFGRRASARVIDLLAQHRVRVLCDMRVEITGPDAVRAFGPDGSRWESAGLDQVVAGARLRGPYLRGLAIADRGFIPIDPYCRVPGRHWIFAAGDVTSYPVKHGGIAAQQADVVARGLATLAGVPDVRRPFRPRLEARLATGGTPLYLTADLIGGEAFGSAASDTPAEGLGPKVIARELDRVLDAVAPSTGQDVEPEIERRV